MGARRLRHKHFLLDQAKIDRVRRYLGARTERDAIDKALSLLIEEMQISERLRPLAGALKNDHRDWPYT